MFTGIIEEMGTIKGMQKISEHAVQMTIGSQEVIKDVNVGDSISVNGVCLTVTNFSSDNFQAEAMPETIKATSLQSLKTGSKVNLERAMAAGGRFGGHFVSGHVDKTGKIVGKQKEENAYLFVIEIPDELNKFIMHKGSITVDGVSLTVFGTERGRFTISLIPHTAAETILGEKGKGDLVNIECDMLAKYVQNMLDQPLFSSKTDITEDFLKNKGFS